MSDNQEQPGQKPEDKDEKKCMLRIWVDGNGKLFIESAINEKEFFVNILADAMKIVAMKPNNVTILPPGLNPTGVSDWMKRSKSWLNKKMKKC